MDGDGADDDGPEKRAPEQLPLDLPVEPSFGRGDFLPAPSNEAALAMIDQWPNWPDRDVAAARPAGKRQEPSRGDLGGPDAGRSTAAPRELPSLDSFRSQAPTALLIDGLDRVEDETALFHLLNFARESDASVLLTARRPPAATRCACPISVTFTSRAGG